MLGEAKESQAFKNIFKATFKDANELKRIFEDERLKEKLKTMGSLYGVPSTQYSEEKEI